MRKSAAVKLTLLPLLAASAMAYAQAPGATDPVPVAAPMSPAWVDGAPAAMEPVISPPGMTPSIDELDCETDPNADQRDDCDHDGELDTGHAWGESVVRGGYGHYFWTGGG